LLLLLAAAITTNLLLGKDSRKHQLGHIADLLLPVARSVAVASFTHKATQTCAARVLSIGTRLSL
jgi:hypothetical protein